MTAKAGAFWGGIAELVFKLLCLICLLISRFQHEWFSTTSLNNDAVSKYSVSSFGILCVNLCNEYLA